MIRLTGFTFSRIVVGISGFAAGVGVSRLATSVRTTSSVSTTEPPMFRVQYSEHLRYLSDKKIVPPTLSELTKKSDTLTRLNTKLDTGIENKDWNMLKEAYTEVLNSLLKEHSVSNGSVQLPFGNIVSRAHTQTVNLANPSASFKDRLAEVFEHPDAFRMFFYLTDDSKKVTIKEHNRYNIIEWKFEFQEKKA